MRTPSFLLLLPVLALSLGLPACEEVLDEALEQQTGCTAAQLGDLQEPALPHCSRAIACCKFLKGECGEVKLFTPPAEVLTACNTNQDVMGETLEQYRSIDEDSCPTYLVATACSDDPEQTRANYRSAVDEGNTASGLAAEGAPSCRLIVDQTINRLNDEVGDKASYLPKACERMD